MVALRNLRDAADQPIPAQRAFQLYRDEIVTSDSAVEARRAEFEQNFDELDEAGIDREDLYLSWDFTVASERNLSERMLSIRDDAFAELGDTNLSDLQVQGSAPNYLVTDTTDYAPCGDDGCAEDPITGEPTEDDRIARQVDGVVAVPCYLDSGRLPAGIEVQLWRRRPAAAERSPPSRAVQMPDPSLGGRRRAQRGAALPLRPRPARLPRGDHRREHQVDGERAQLRLLRHRLGRVRDHRCPRRFSPVSRTSPTSRASSTACSRATSTSCSSGAS